LGEILEGLAMGDVVLFNGHLVHFTTVWYILFPSGIGNFWSFFIFPVLVCCIKKNLATLELNRNGRCWDLKKYFRPTFRNCFTLNAANCTQKMMNRGR
jgi:hypothetical protein